MTTVHSIDVALRATTGAFDKAMLESAGLTRKEFNGMKKSVSAVEPALDKTREALEQFDKLAKHGAFTNEQYAEGSRRLKQEIAAQEQGFRSSSDAVRDAEKVLLRNETASERLARETERLNRLMRTGQLSTRDYRREVDRLGKEYQETSRRGRSTGAAVADQVPILSRWNGTMAAGGPAAVGAAAGIAIFTAGAYAVGRAATFASEKIQEQWVEIDKIGKTSAKLGLSVNELVGLRLAISEGSGMEDNSIDMALQRFVRRTAEASKGLGEAKGAIEDLGLDAVELQAMGPQKSLEAIAEKMAGIEDSGERLRLAFKLFDSEGAAIVNTLRGGPEAIREAAEFSERWLGLTTQQTSQVELMHDTLGRVDVVGKGIARTFAAELAPAVSVIGEDLIAGVSGFEDMDEAAQELAVTIAGIHGGLKDIKNIALGSGEDLLSGLMFESSAKAGEDVVRAREKAKENDRTTGNDEAEAAKKKVFTDAASAIKSSFADPSNALAKRIAEIKDLQKRKLIDPTEARRASAEAIKQFESGLASIDPFGSAADQIRQQVTEVREAFQAGAIDVSMADDVFDRLGENFATDSANQLQAAFDDLSISPEIFDKLDKRIRATEIGEAEKFSEELDKQAETLRESLKTPAVDLAEKLAGFQELFDTERITAGERDKASDRAIDTFLNADGKQPQSLDVGAVAKGSAEAFRAEMRGTQNEARQQLDVAKRHLKESQAAGEKLTDLVTAIEGLNIGEGV